MAIGSSSATTQFLFICFVILDRQLSPMAMMLRGGGWIITLKAIKIASTLMDYVKFSNGKD
jgi:hypothetical protein